MKMPLSELASVQLGFNFRSAIEPSPGSLGRLLQLKDVNESIISGETTLPFDDSTYSENVAIQEGDIVFRSRGPVFRSAITRSLSSRTIIAAPLYRIRCGSLILPDYLNWFLNLTSVQPRLNTLAKGSAQRLISIADFGNLEITVPDLATQKTVAELCFLQERERTLVDQIQSRKGQLVTSMLENLIQETRSNT